MVADTVDNGPTEVGIFGREGFTGVPLLLGADTSQHRIVIQVDGHTGLRIEADRLLSMSCPLQSGPLTMTVWIEVEPHPVFGPVFMRKPALFSSGQACLP